MTKKENKKHGLQKLNVRDKRSGMRLLKKGYNPMPYNLKDRPGKRIATGNKADGAANCLATLIWGTPAEHVRHEQEDAAPLPGTNRKIMNEDTGMYTGEIAMAELMRGERSKTIARPQAKQTDLFGMEI